MTPRETILAVIPDAQLDCYECLRGWGKPCWFIRHGLQGEALSGICASPKAAWKNALMWLREKAA
jgi:hypothetical protein